MNLHTLPLVTVGVGFGIDYGLYIVSRIIEEYRDHLDFRRRCSSGCRRPGRP